jgi:hydroxymethylpyrimidine/phosphomethylpyrimidine kinase
VGKSPKQIIAEYIMHEAVTLLENSRLTIQEISDSLGFSSQAMFSKFFRNNCGKSPTQVRKDY